MNRFLGMSHPKQQTPHRGYIQYEIDFTMPYQLSLIRAATTKRLEFHNLIAKQKPHISCFYLFELDKKAVSEQQVVAIHIIQWQTDVIPLR